MKCQVFTIINPHIPPPALLTGLCHGSCSLHPRLALLSDACQQLLNLSNCSAWVETLWAGLGTVHDSVAPVHGERISQLVQSLHRVLVPAVDDPPVGLNEDSWT